MCQFSFQHIFLSSCAYLCVSCTVPSNGLSDKAMEVVGGQMVYQGLRTVSLSMTHTQQASSSLSHCWSPIPFPRLSLVAQKLRHLLHLLFMHTQVCRKVGLQEATKQKMETEACVYFCDWVPSFSIYTLICAPLCLCVCEQQSRPSSLQPFQYWFTAAETAQKPFVSYSFVILLTLTLSFYHLPPHTVSIQPLDGWIGLGSAHLYF